MKVQYFLSDNTYSSFWCKCWNTYCLYAVFIRPIKMFSCFAILSIILKIMAALWNVFTFFRYYSFLHFLWISEQHFISIIIMGLDMEYKSKKIEYLESVMSKGCNSMIIKREIQNTLAINKQIIVMQFIRSLLWIRNSSVRIKTHWAHFWYECLSFWKFNLL
jgi:hypothetical protein